MTENGVDDSKRWIAYFNSDCAYASGFSTPDGNTTLDINKAARLNSYSAFALSKSSVFQIMLAPEFTNILEELYEQEVKEELLNEIERSIEILSSFFTKMTEVARKREKNENKIQS